MLSILIILVLTSATANAQMNGEFWWLNDKFAEYKGVKPDPVKYEEVSEFENDETDKIVFNDINSSENDKSRSNADNWNFHDRTKLKWPKERKAKSTEVPSTTTKLNASSGDVLDFKFPDSDNFIWKDFTNTKRETTPIAKNSSHNITTKNKTVLITDKVTFKVYKEETTQVQDICTYLKKGECKIRNGLIYIKRESPMKISADSQFICCILPLPTDKQSKIYFADEFPTNKRLKRSAINENGMSLALNQRNALLRRKFPPQNIKNKGPITTEPTKLTHKIVTAEDDYEDPYANIKNSHQASSTKYGYGNEDYIEDYVVELPRPGLVGLYSDHGPSSSWTYVNSGKTGSPYGTTDDEVDDDVSSPSYSAFDPRLVDRVSIGAFKPPKRIPTKFTADDPDEFPYDSKSQTVKVHTNPDFRVLEGFKLINLFRNTNRVYSKNGRRTTTTERETDSSECIHKRPILVDSSAESYYDDVFDDNEEVFDDCGRAVKDPLKDFKQDKHTGEAEIGSHPWLALVVLTKSPQSIQCYASLVHPRAAVTAADCVNGRTSPGQVTLLAGIWDLEDNSSVRSQKRMALVHVDSQYKPGNLAHNLAMLHWKRPLQLGVNVQPACVADPHVGDMCKLVGWGGYDQAIRARPRWQRATILTPRQCNERLSSSQRHVALPPDTFCASVDSRASVTGVGGPLTCNIGDRQSIVGVAVWRDNALVLLPLHEWTGRAIAALRIQ